MTKIDQQNVFGHEFKIIQFIMIQEFMIKHFKLVVIGDNENYLRTIFSCITLHSYLINKLINH